ncbi:MAG: phosphotransferase family protein [Sterolibacterium sp.]|nr:phosphotransferase family protein [Sterolibacterium sp.]
MNIQTLPYLNCLKSTFNSLSASLSGNPDIAMQIGAANRLLDYMIEQRTAAPKLKADCYAALLKLLPAIEKVVGRPPAAPAQVGLPSKAEEITPASSVASAVQELKAICGEAEPDAFDRCLQLAGQIQRHLFALNAPPAMALCKSIVRIEADYNRKFEAAVAAQSAASATASTSKAAATARNAKVYDEEKLLDFIRKSFPQEADLGIKRSEFVTGGYSKFTVSIVLSNTRTLPEDIILRGDASGGFGGASVVDEYRLIKAMYDHGVRVPKPLAVEETGKVFGSPFLLVEKKPSTIIGGQFNLPKPNKSVSDDVAAQLAAVHRVPLAAAGNRVSGANLRTSEKVLDWVKGSFSAWRPLDMPSPVFETAFEWLLRHAALNDKAPRTVVHGDFGLNNILIYDNKVSAILDWEFAHIGNPAYDLGYFYTQATALSSWEEFLAAYAKAGMPIPDEEQLNYNILLGATRLGTMICQVTRSFTSGAEPGIAGAVVVGDNYYEEMIRRISGALDRVL